MANFTTFAVTLLPQLETSTTGSKVQRKRSHLFVLRIKRWTESAVLNMIYCLNKFEEITTSVRALTNCLYRHNDRKKYLLFVLLDLFTMLKFFKKFFFKKQQFYGTDIHRYIFYEFYPKLNIHYKKNIFFFIVRFIYHILYLL